MRSLTFGKKIASGFALSFTLLAIIGGVAYRGITTLSRTSYWAAGMVAAAPRPGRASMPITFGNIFATTPKLSSTWWRRPFFGKG